MGSRTKLLLGLISGVCVLVGATATAAPGSSRSQLGSPSADTGSCHRGYKPAIIAGNFKCLRVGQRCARRYQAAYRKYGFNCVNGRLRKKSATPARPAPPEEPPPAPIPPPQAPGQPGHYYGLTSQNETFEFDVTSEGWAVRSIKTGQINEGCTPPAHIYGNRYDFGTYTIPLTSDGSFTLDYPHQSYIDFPDTRVTTTARLTITGHVSGAVASGNLQLAVTFTYHGTTFSCGSGLQTWNATRTG